MSDVLADAEKSMRELAAEQDRQQVTPNAGQTPARTKSPMRNEDRFREGHEKDISMSKLLRDCASTYEVPKAPTRL